MKSTTNWLGEALTLRIEKVAHGGIFIARHEGRVVFVSHVLPGELVNARVYEDRGGAFCRAEPEQILEASPERVAHFWREAGPGGAGGAEFGHIELGFQRQLKSEVLREALERFAGLSEAELAALNLQVEALPGDEQKLGLGYRTRVQLHVSPEGIAGPYRERSHEVVSVRKLPLAVEEINELGVHLKNWQDVKKIEIAASNTGQLQWWVDRKLKGDERLIERVAGRSFRISGGGFWQVHEQAAEVLAGAVSSMSHTLQLDPAADNLDLYGGVGLFSGTLAQSFGSDLKITSVESADRATSDAKINLSDLRHAKVVTNNVEKFLEQRIGSSSEGISTGTVVLDPPRSGAGGRVTNQLTQLAPRAIIYVACDPVSLARDLATLRNGGYRVSQISAFDLFPHTHHFETIAALERE